MWGFDCCPKVHFDGIPVNHKCMTLNSFSCMTVFYRKNIKGKTEAVLVIVAVHWSKINKV